MDIKEKKMKFLSYSCLIFSTSLLIYSLYNYMFFQDSSPLGRPVISTFLIFLCSMYFFSLSYSFFYKRLWGLKLYNRLLFIVIPFIIIFNNLNIKMMWRTKNFLLLAGSLLVVIILIYVKLYLNKNKSLFTDSQDMLNKITKNIAEVTSAFILLPFLLFSVCMTPISIKFNIDDEDRTILDKVENDSYIISTYYNYRPRGMGDNFTSVELVNKSDFLEGENTLWNDFSYCSANLKIIDSNTVQLVTEKRIHTSSDYKTDTVLLYLAGLQ